MHRGGDFSAEVDYSSNLSGGQSGIDWTVGLAQGDSIALGFAVGHGRDQIKNISGLAFDNTLKGTNYSTYASWQQGLGERNAGLFAQMMLGYGDLSFQQSAQALSSGIGGAFNTLSANYDGDWINFDSRFGWSIKTGKSTMAQPYFSLGWIRQSTDTYDNGNLAFAAAHSQTWRGGMGLTGRHAIDFAAAQVDLWLDAGVSVDFASSAQIETVNFRLDQATRQRFSYVGTGIDVQLTQRLGAKLGAYASGGDVRNSLAANIGVEYRF